MDPNKPDLLRTSEACELLRASRAKLRQLRQRDVDFPAPIILGPRGLRWRRRELEEFLDRRRAHSTAPAAGGAV